jgi:hypothetical protein
MFNKTYGSAHADCATLDENKSKPRRRSYSVNELDEAAIAAIQKHSDELEFNTLDEVESIAKPVVVDKDDLEAITALEAREAIYAAAEPQPEPDEVAAPAPKKERKVKPKITKPVETPKRTIAAERSRQHRESTKDLVGAAPARVPNWRDEFATYVRTLKERLQQPNASARKLRRHARQIAEDWIAYQELAAELGKAPTATEFGERLRLDRVHRWRRLRRLVTVETVAK